MSKQMPLSETLNELNAQLRQILNPDGDLPQIEATTHPTPSGSTETDNPAPVESGKRLSVPAKAGLGVLAAGLVLGVGGATANAVKPEWQLYDNSIGRILGSGSSATETVGTQPQLNCSEPIASVKLGMVAGMLLNYPWITGPKEKKEAAKNPDFKPTKYVNTFDPDALPIYKSPDLQKLSYPVLPTLDSLLQGKLEAPTGSVERLRAAYFSGTDLRIMACPTDANPSVYLTNKNGVNTVDFSKLKLVVKVGDGTNTSAASASKFTYWYDNQLPIPKTGVESKDIADRDINRLNKVLTPDSSKPEVLNPKVNNSIIAAALASFDSGSCKDLLETAAKNGVLDSLKAQKKGKYTPTGSFILPSTAWASAHSSNDYEPDVKLIDPQTKCALGEKGDN